jgi:ankyrin repeat protein
MRRLVAEGGDVNGQDARGVRPLHWAAWQGHVDAVQDTCTSAVGDWG